MASHAAAADCDGVREMEMDELFFGHQQEEHESAGSGSFEEEFEDYGSVLVRGDDDDDDMDRHDRADDDIDVIDVDAEYIPGSSLTPNNPLYGNTLGQASSAAGGSQKVPQFQKKAPDGLFQRDDWVTLEKPDFAAPNEFVASRLAGALNGAPVQQQGSPQHATPATLSAVSCTAAAAAPELERERFRPPCVSDFQTIRVIGKGSFGKVFLVRQSSTGRIFAMKVLKKENIVKRNQVEHTRTERAVLGYVHHPFVVGMHAAFQTRDKLFFVLDYCAGGELFRHLQKLGKFAEPRARFYIAELTLALQHVHGLGVVYRDLKPENVLLDQRGHVRLTDFGLSKEGVTRHAQGAHSFCGTPEYLAPEILARRGHGRAVDWWSLGALLYEMLTGLPPFYSRDREKLFQGIKSGELAYPSYLGAAAASLLAALLHRDPTLRLGSGPSDADEIKAHRFFDSVDWAALLDGTTTPPWTPTVVGSLDTSQFDREFTSLPIHSPPTRNSAARPLAADDDTFSGFTFAPEHALHPRVGQMRREGGAPR